jgi:putative DNA primase/helicase
MSIAQKRDFPKLIASIDILSFLETHLPGGQVKGGEYKVRNPTRPDKKAGSFSINIASGVWKDFSTGEKGGTDMISLYAYVNKCNQGQAYDELCGKFISTPTFTPAPTASPALFTLTPRPPEDSAPPPVDKHREDLYEYTNTDGGILFWVERYLKSDGEKSFRFYFWGQIDEDTESKWHKKRPSDTPILWKIHEILATDKQILLVEGEKTTIAAQKLFPNYLVTTWCGGGGGANKVDLKPLKDKAVWLWPDADEAGYKAMDAIKKKLPQSTIIDVKSLNKPAKWDLADAEKGEDFSALFEECDEEDIEIDDFPYCSATNRPLNMYQNVEHLLGRYNIDLSFDVVKKQTIVNIPGSKFYEGNKDKLNLAWITNLCNMHTVPRVDLVPWIALIADKRNFNPVFDYITSRPWDGVSRIDDFFNTIQCTNNKLRDIYMRRWMIGAVAVGVCEKGLAHPGVLTFLADPSAGKSAWSAKLIPRELDLFMPEFKLLPDDKDNVSRAVKHWIVELAEADATVNSSASGALKAFLTRRTDYYRSPYDRSDTIAPRHTCFIGTVNEAKFLKDPTGNRRWWVLDVKSINYEHTLDMQQVWAEFYELHKQGEQFHLTDEEYKLQLDANDDYRPTTAVEESIILRYDWENGTQSIPITALEVLEECGFDTKTDRRHISKEANRVLRNLCDEDSKKTGGVYKFLLPRLLPLTSKY